MARVSTAIDPSAVARVLGIKTEFVNLAAGTILFLPQRVAVVGQGSTASTFATTKRQVTSALEAATLYGFGSPIHLACLQLLPLNGDGVGSIPVTVYPLEDAGGGAAATGDITPSGAVTVAAEVRVNINNILSEAFAVAVGDTVAQVVTKMTAAINAVVEMPVTAVDGTTAVNLTSKWKGPSANFIKIAEVSESVDSGLTYTLPASGLLTGGLVNPSISDALAQVGDVWETMFLNCLNVDDTTTLDLYKDFGEGRWGALVRKPCVVFSGDTQTTVAAAITVPDARKTDRVNSQLVSPGSDDLPFVVAARQLARIVKKANENPPHDYGSQKATGLTPGADGDQWTHPERDRAVKGGSSTVEVKDEVVNVSDVVTFYHPTGDPLPAYRFVVDIVRLMNIIFNIDVVFNTDEWDGAPLIPDNQPTTNRSAKQPKAAKSAAAAIVDGLGSEAILSDPETSKAGIVSEIDGSNPKRLNLLIPVSLSGNTNIKSIDLNFGFFFGG